MVEVIITCFDTGSKVTAQSKTINSNKHYKNYEIELHDNSSKHYEKEEFTIQIRKEES